MKVIIDRFESSFAVCETENKETIHIETGKLPSESREGDVLIIEDGLIRADREGTAERKARIDKLCDGLWE